MEIQFSRDNSLGDDDEQSVDVAGIRSYVLPEEAEDDSCTIRTPYRTYTNSRGDRTVELFQLTVYAPLSVRQLCSKAQQFAVIVVRNIAKRRAQGVT